MAELGYRIRPGVEGDVPAILELMRASLGEGELTRTAEFWRWKHVDNPFGPSPVRVAETDDGLAGVRVFMRWTFHSGARAVRAVRAVDTATHPSFQGRGIFRELTLHLVDEVAREGIPFVYNTPNDKSRPGYLKMRWRALGRLSLWVRPSPLKLAQRGLGRLRGELPSAEPRGEALPLAADLLERSEVFRLKLEETGLHTRASTEYLRWRYLECPAVRYGLASVDPEAALVVFRVRARKGLSELTLCEALGERSRRGASALRATLRQIVRVESPDYAVAAAHPSALESAVFAMSGFVPAPSLGPILTVRTLSAVDGVDPGSMKSWHGSIGDFELF